MTSDQSVLGVTHSRPGFAVPPGACDCHTHVFGPAEAFPFDAGRLYTPGPALVEDLLVHQHALGLSRVVIVQPSPYGTDNACTVDALRRLGPALARGVAVIGPGTTDAELREMHEAGVRGVRVNLETSGCTDPGFAAEALSWAAARVAPLGWHVQTYAALAVIAALRAQILALPVPLVIDHFGRPSAAAGVEQPGFSALLELVRSGKAYVKLSAPHRISARPGHADAVPIARTLIAANPERMLWGSDWPHPGGRPGQPRRPDAIEPFRPEDDGAALDRLAHWAGDEATLARILAHNPARLYGF
jgi:predicted TIM-barrel fold metal-dependent hydrolase